MVIVPDSVKKKRKKIWVPILAPRGFKTTEVGEGYVYLPEQLLNKRIGINLSNLSQDPKKQNTNITLKVYEIKENKAVTEIVGYNLFSSYLRRLGKMSKERVEQSVMTKTKDNTEIRIKALALTKHKTNRSILTAISKKMKESLIETVQKQDYNALINSIINFEFQKNMHKELKIIYPLSYALIKSLKKIK